MKCKKLIAIVTRCVVTVSLLTGCFNNEKTLTLSNDTTNDDNKLVQIVEEDLNLDIGEKIFTVGFGYEDKVYGGLVELDNRGRYNGPVGEMIYIKDGKLYETGKNSSLGVTSYNSGKLEYDKNWGGINSNYIQNAGVDYSDEGKSKERYSLYDWILEKEYLIEKDLDNELLYTGTIGVEPYVKGKDMTSVAIMQFGESNPKGNRLIINLFDEGKSYSTDINYSGEEYGNVIYCKYLEKYFSISNKKIYELNLIDEKVEIANEYEIEINNNLYDIENIIVMIANGYIIDNSKVIFQLYEDRVYGSVFAGLILYDFEKMKSYDIYTNVDKNKWNERVDYGKVEDVSKEGIVVFNQNNTLTIGQIIDTNMEIIKDIKFDIDSETERCEISAKINETGDTIVVSALVFNKVGSTIKRTYYKQYKINYN